MTFTIDLDWWLVPAFITAALLIGWRIWGVRMSPNNGGMFPDFVGAFVEVGGYLIAVLLSVIAWLIWVVLK